MQVDIKSVNFSIFKNIYNYGLTREEISSYSFKINAKSTVKLYDNAIDYGYHI